MVRKRSFKSQLLGEIKSYTIEFTKIPKYFKKSFWFGDSWIEMNSKIIYNMIIDFAFENGIIIKKIKIRRAFKKSYIKLETSVIGYETMLGFLNDSVFEDMISVKKY